MPSFYLGSTSFPGGGYDVGMAIYTTELITDRDYNIPEGRLPLEYAVDQANKAKTHSENTEVHVTADEKASWNHTTQHGDIVYDLNKMFPDAGETTNGPTKLWKQFYAINRIRRYFYDIDAANGDTDPETGFTYSKKMMVPGIKIRHYRAALSGYIPDPFWATYSWMGGNIDWNWNPDTDGNTNEFDDFSNTTKWQFSVTEHQFDLHLDGETTDSSGNFTRHITDEEREKWNAAVGGVKAIFTVMYAGEELRTDSNGNGSAKFGEVHIPESAPTGWYCVGTKLIGVDFDWVEHKQGERTLVWRPLIAQLTTTLYMPLDVIMTVPGLYTAETPMTCV